MQLDGTVGRERDYIIKINYGASIMLMLWYKPKKGGPVCLSLSLWRGGGELYLEPPLPPTGWNPELWHNIILATSTYFNIWRLGIFFTASERAMAPSSPMELFPRLQMERGTSVMTDVQIHS